MACATLKRSLDWESLNQRPTKRRRCNPFGNSDRNGHVRSQNTNVILPTNEVNYGMQPSNFREKKNESVFKKASLSTVSPDQMVLKINDEIKRLHKRKDLYFPLIHSERMQDSESSGSEMGPDSPRRPESPGNARLPEKALFTFKQVQMICERMLMEREEELREKYDAILTTKLAEQYDAFVKFTYDQIQTRYEAPPSYLS